MADVLKIVGEIAGVGGLALGVLFLLYRDFVQSIIRERLFSTLTSGQATVLFGSVLVFTFTVAILGLFAGLASGGGAQRFIILVVILLVFILAVLVIAVRFGSGAWARRTGSAEEGEGAGDPSVRRLVERGRPDEAERVLGASGLGPETEEYWYWMARIALARTNPEVAARYLEKALERDARGEFSLALQIRLLLLGGDQDRERAVRVVADSRGVSDELDAWLDGLEAAGMLGPGLHTSTELDAACPLPPRPGRSVERR